MFGIYPSIDQLTTNDQGPMSNEITPQLTIGHWDLVIGASKKSHSN
jgi:hypothetical protein